jgi:hypothetical protein
MTDWQEMEPDEAFLFHAWADMLTVYQTASVLVRHDAEVRANPAVGQLVDVAFVRDVITAGLVVAYARPFQKSTGGTQQLKEEIVPVEHVNLHRHLLQRRRKIDAHTDLDAPDGLRRVALQGASGHSSGQRPPSFKPNTLEEFAELTGKLMRTLQERRNALAAKRQPEDA